MPQDFFERAWAALEWRVKEGDGYCRLQIRLRYIGWYTLYQEEIE